jgi:hypothetical protein
MFSFDTQPSSDSVFKYFSKELSLIKFVEVKLILLNSPVTFSDSILSIFSTSAGLTHVFSKIAQSP